MRTRLPALLLVACCSFLPLAAAGEESEAPVVAAPKIVKALSAKDIVLDLPGQGRVVRPPAIDLQVQFNFGSADLRPQGKRQLDELAQALKSKALLTAGFALGGHTDRVGDETFNMQLSRDRAHAVKVYLQEAHLISPDRLQATGFGYSRLADPAHPTAAVNRRVEVRRVALLKPPRRHSAPRPDVSGGRLVNTPE